MQRILNSSVLIFLLILSARLNAQVPDFAAAERYDAPELLKRIGTASVIPFFFHDSSRFWFVQESLTGSDEPYVGSKKNTHSPLEAKIKSTTYFIVDPIKKLKTELFDKRAIEEGIRKLIPLDFNAEKISYGPNFDLQGKVAIISYGKEKYDYDILNKKVSLHHEPELKKRPVYLAGTPSPDGHWLLYSIKHNLYVRKSADSLGIQLTVDGAMNYSFSTSSDRDLPWVSTGTNAVWASDSRSFYVLRQDSRKVGTMSVINSVASPRPYVNTYPYQLPGDKDVTQYELFIGNPLEGKIKKVDISKWPDQEVFKVAAADDDREMFFVRKKRSRDEMELCAVDLRTGSLRVVIHELSRPFINEDLFSVSIANNGQDIIWWSDRTGWGQYYHYNGKGELLNVITKGEWTAGKIIGIDSLKKQFYFYGYGREKAINPNYAFVYKVDFAGHKQRLLTPENATHKVFFSPDKKFFVDNFSRIDLEPSSIVRSAEGDFTIEVMKPDFRELYRYGWKQPEQFELKAKDGITDLYGLMWKPFNFDPKKKYPIISQVYPGPQIETVWSEFTVLDRYNNTALAQLGFIVVVMGHRGGTPVRSAAYYKYGYGNLRDYALEDDKYGLEQLAGRFNYIDLSRVGIFGHSGGGMMATAALCTYPDFYKVAVSSSANHDNTIYNRTWGETYQGSKPVALNQSLAYKLKGHLLMVSGESDANVNPAGTMRMADALIKAGKDFDLLILPGQGHTYEDPYKQYFQRKLRSYFARYLLE